MLGYFEPARKKPLPRYPRRVGLVTSPTGSAVRDVLEVLARRWPALEVWVCPVPRAGRRGGRRDRRRARRCSTAFADGARRASSSPAAAAASKTCGRSTRRSSPRPSTARASRS